jgi:hypothetical protein
MDQLTKEQEAWTKFHDLMISTMNDQVLWSDPNTMHEQDLKTALSAVCREYINVLEVVALEQKPWLKQKH